MNALRSIGAFLGLSLLWAVMALVLVVASPIVLVCLLGVVLVLIIVCICGSFGPK